MMSKNAITPINNAWQVETGAASQPPAKTDFPAVQAGGLIPMETPVSKPGAPVENQPAREENPGLPVSNESHLALRFLVDEKTNELTVYVIDRQSKRVLRSIPAADLSKLKAGDLLKLTA